MSRRETLHRLLDNIPDEHLDAAEYAIGALQPDALARALYLAPYDDEPFTEEDRRRLDEIRANPQWVTGEEAMRMLDELCADPASAPSQSST